MHPNLSQRLCISMPQCQVVLADIFRSYDRGKLCVDGLRANVHQLLEDEDLKIAVKVLKDAEPERSLDTILISMSPLRANVPE